MTHFNAHLRRQVVSSILGGMGPTQVAKARGLAVRYIITLVTSITGAKPSEVQSPVKLQRHHQTLRAWLSSGDGRAPTPLEESLRARLGTRTYNALEAMIGKDGWSLFDVARRSEDDLRRAPGVGLQAVLEVKQSLASLGLTLSSTDTAIRDVRANSALPPRVTLKTKAAVDQAIKQLEELMSAPDLSMEAKSAIASAADLVREAVSLTGAPAGKTIAA